MNGTLLRAQLPWCQALVLCLSSWQEWPLDLQLALAWAVSPILLPSPPSAQSEHPGGLSAPGTLNSWRISNTQWEEKPASETVEGWAR